MTRTILGVCLSTIALLSGYSKVAGYGWSDEGLFINIRNMGDHC
ncbi:hypothetical protein [Parendozoicomonas sp. Alg238-R29]|nr:hypothetical protein [Parendozoicomonas sp. Alg238-R29]